MAPPGRGGGAGGQCPAAGGGTAAAPPGRWEEEALRPGLSRRPPCVRSCEAMAGGGGRALRLCRPPCPLWAVASAIIGFIAGYK